MKKVSRFVLVLWLLLASAAAQKQSNAKAAPAAATRLIAVKVKGKTTLTDQEITAASGLQLGQPAADGDFREAAQRLGETGMFKDVAYSFTSSPSGVRLELEVDDIDKSKLVPAHFENFVGFTDQELQSSIQRRVPLFKQFVPMAGNLSTRVSEALQAILVEKQLPGRVSFVREGDESGEHLSGIAYRVDEVDIRIQSVEFPGASTEMTALLAVPARHLIGAEYTRTRLSQTAEFDFLPLYLQRGYLKAAFQPSQARMPPSTTDASTSEAKTDTTGEAKAPIELQVVAILPVASGTLYSIAAVEWKGNSVIPTPELSPLIHLAPGQPADGVRLARDLENVAKLYRSRGYMRVKAKPDPQFDDEKGTVRYQLQVSEGDQYKMGELEITGLDTEARARLQAAWTLQEGQPFNADYPEKFREETTKLVPRGDWILTIHLSPDAKSKTVDVEVHFKQQ